MKILQHKVLFYGIVSGLAVLLSLWLYFIEPHKGSFQTNYNDYLIFKQSFPHILQHKDLYIHYPDEYNDLFKYSPSFAIFMAPFACLPDIIGLICWNTLNLVVLYYALRKFPFPNDKYTVIAMGFILIEALTALVSTQSNCIIAGLFLITFECLEKKKIVLATLFAVLSVFIKPFGLALFILFLFYPGKVKAFGFSALWCLLIFLLPLIVISPAGLWGEYNSWWQLLKNDHDVSYGISLMGLMHSWFGTTAKNSIVAGGAIVLLLPLLRYKSFPSQAFKILFLSSMLIWVIIFNHKGETPGYIIAVSGVAIWFFSQSYTRLNLALLAGVLLFTVLEPTDVYSKSIRNNFLTPYFICVVPCLIVWVKIVWELMTKDFSAKV